MIKMKALRAFPFAADGIRVIPIEKDAEFDCPDNLAEGLVAALYCESVDGKMKAQKVDPNALVFPGANTEEARILQEARDRKAADEQAAVDIEAKRVADEALARSRTGAQIEDPPVDETELRRRQHHAQSADPQRDQPTVVAAAKPGAAGKVEEAKPSRR